jgi:TonB family protein
VQKLSVTVASLTLVLVASIRANGIQQAGGAVGDVATSREVVDIRGIWKGDKLNGKKAAARGLDVRQIQLPQKTRNVSPIYPVGAQHAGQTGTVVLECRIDTDGIPRACKVIRHVSPLLDEAALRCVGQWRYEPLTLRGEPRPALVELTVSFTLG